MGITCSRSKIYFSEVPQQYYTINRSQKKKKKNDCKLSLTSRRFHEKNCFSSYTLHYFYFFLFSNTAWVGSVSVGVMYLFGPITSGLSERFGCKIVAFLGGFLCILGLLLTSYATDLPKLYVTYGILWGIGSSFCYFPTLTAPGEYFCHRLSLVNGIVTAG